jgi:TolB protein
MATHAADAPRKLAYSRGKALYVANLDGSGAKKVAAGSWPDLSPDGTRLAFNTEDPSGKTPERSIAVADAATGKVTKVPNIPSNNCHSPVWSPDGSRILFQIYADEDWHIAVIGSDGSDFRYLKRSGPKGHSFYSAIWAPDGKGIFCQDLDAIYRCGLDGAVQKQWEVTKLFPKGGLSSAARLAVSPDGGTLLVDVEMDEDITRKDWDGPPPAIWALDMASSKVTRLTPKGLFAWGPRWLNGEELLCLVQPVSAKEPSIYRMSANGKTRQALIKNASDVSVAR